jgi:hypothetical protein
MSRANCDADEWEVQGDVADPAGDLATRPREEISQIEFEGDIAASHSSGLFRERDGRGNRGPDWA